MQTLTTTQELGLTVIPRKEGGHRYLKRGLLCKMVKPGIYRIRMEDGSKFAGDIVLVSFMEPWASQKVSGYLPFCRTHGSWGAQCGLEGCELEMRKTMMARWVVLCRFADPKYFEVVIMETCPTKKREHSKALPAAGAGFSVVHL